MRARTRCQIRYGYPVFVFRHCRLLTDCQQPLRISAGCIHRLFVPVAGFSPSAGEQVPVSIEGNVYAGMPHLIPNRCGRLAVGDQLAREEVAEVVKPCSIQISLIDDGPPDVRFKPVWIDESVAVSREDESEIGISDFEVGEEPHHAVRGRNAAQGFARFRARETIATCECHPGSTALRWHVECEFHYRTIEY
jgi:hypothetical protein